MNPIVSLVLLLFASPGVSSKTIDFQSCASPKFGKISSVDVTPCDEDPCVFKRGSNETVTITFTPNEMVTEAKIFAYGIRGIFHVRLPIGNPDACQDHGLTCPLKSGVEVKLDYTAYVQESCPTGKFKVEALMKDQNGDVVICGIINVEVA